MEVEKVEKARSGSSTNGNDGKYFTRSCTTSNEVPPKKKVKQATK